MNQKGGFSHGFHFPLMPDPSVFLLSLISPPVSLTCCPKTPTHPNLRPGESERERETEPVVAVSKVTATAAATFEPDQGPLFGLRKEDGNGGKRAATAGDGVAGGSTMGGWLFRWPGQQPQQQ